jgi:hypothetical protein
MKKLTSIIIVVIICVAFSGFSQKPEMFDLHKLVRGNKIEVFNRELTVLKDGNRNGIRLSKADDEGVAWLKGVEFSEGTIEFDVQGEDVKQHSFVGIAFHGVDNATFDAVYLRPFNFRVQDGVAKSHGIQYISLPNSTWRVLREQFPNQYENIILPELDPNAWQRFKIVIEGNKVSAYINGRKEPSLVVTKITTTKTGKIGFYVADTSGGDFANITITKVR